MLHSKRKNMIKMKSSNRMGMMLLSSIVCFAAYLLLFNGGIRTVSAASSTRSTTASLERGPALLAHPTLHPLSDTIVHALTVSFNESLARYLLVHSAAAYSHSSEACLSRYLSPTNVNVIANFSALLYDATVYGYVAIDDARESIVLSFQGSRSVSQIVSEAAHSFPLRVASSLNASDVLMEGYFYNATMSLYASAVKAVAVAMQSRPTYRFYATGHSLGAAIATATAYLLVVDTVVPRERAPIVYTFGQPRVGNVVFATLYNKYVFNTFRVVNSADIVPHVPPCPETWSFQCSNEQAFMRGSVAPLLARMRALRSVASMTVGAATSNVDAAELASSPSSSSSLLLAEWDDEQGPSTSATMKADTTESLMWAFHSSTEVWYGGGAGVGGPSMPALLPLDDAAADDNSSASGRDADEPPLTWSSIVSRVKQGARRVVSRIVSGGTARSTQRVADDDSGLYKTCVGDPEGEDPSCSDSLSVIRYSVTDHEYYYQVRVGQLCDGGAVVAPQTVLA